MGKDGVIDFKFQDPQGLKNPTATGFGKDHFQFRVLFKYAGPEQRGEGTVGVHVYFTDEHHSGTGDITVIR